MYEITRPGSTGMKEDKAMYFLVVHGTAPELWSVGVAFRRDRRFVPEGQKVIRCPYCGRPFTMVGYSTKVEVFRRPRKNGRECHALRPCKACHEEVGIVFA
jgi:hypothetical protein